MWSADARVSWCTGGADEGAGDADEGEEGEEGEEVFGLALVASVQTASAVQP